MKSTKFKILALLSTILIIMFLAGCTGTNKETGKSNSENQQTAEKSIVLATTTSTQDSGLLDVLVPAFEKKTNIKVKVIAVGTGAAIEMGKKGDADVLLVHARKDEDKFMAEGYGSDRKDVMHNEFFIVGPAADPAKIKNLKITLDAFKSIASSKSPFISRDDKSGTNKKELSIWEKSAITPSETWYIKAGVGMGETLSMANEKQAYTLVDSATYLSMKDKFKLELLLRGDKVLFNPYGVIVVNKDKFPKVNFEGAKEFSDYITSPEGQEVIAAFGKDKLGESLFIPDAVK